MPWLIAKNEEPDKVLAQHGWTGHRPNGMEFMSQTEAQAHIDHRRIPGHPVQLLATEKASWEPSAARTDYDPFGARP